MSESNLKALTYRVESIPGTLKKADFIKDCFFLEDQNDLTLKSFCPSVDCPEDDDEAEHTATVLFRPRHARPRGPRLQHKELKVGRDFMGFTPLYVPQRDKGPIVADIIAVTGLAGHAFGSWAHSDEHMWLRDYLPKFATNARILTYGYSADLMNGSSYAILQDHAIKFVHRLVDMREEGQCESRPIVLIGHSLGCLLIKKAITDAGALGINSSRFPVRAIIFLAAPHEGLDTTALQTLIADKPPRTLVKELEPGSPSLRDLSNRFAQIAKDIDILSCYEMRPTKTVIQCEDGIWRREGPEILMVNPDSAQLQWPKEKRVAADDNNHSDIAKLKKGQSGIFADIRSAIRHALRPTAEIVADVNHGARATQTMRGYEFSRTEAIPHGRDAVIPPPYLGGVESNQGRPLHYPGRDRIPPPVPPRESIQRPSHSPIPSDFASQPETVSLPTRPLEKEDQSDPVHMSNTAREPENIRVPPPIPARPSRRSLEPADLVDDPRPDETRPSETSREDPSPEISSSKPVANCSRCLLDIPNDVYHWRCNAYMSPEDEHMCLCQDCYDNYTLCSMHDEKLFRTIVKPRGGVHHYVPYIDTQASKTDTVITKAIRENNLANFETLIKNKAQLCARDEYGCTPLHLAAQLGRAECARLLLKAGAPREIRQDSGYTPLLTAIEYDHIAVVRVLLLDDVDVNSSGGDLAATPVSYAAYYGQSDILALLLEYRASTEPCYGQTRTALHLAAYQGDEKAVSILLDAGAKPNAKEGEFGNTPLREAASRGHVEVIKMLLSNKSVVDSVNDGGQTPLHVAVDSSQSGAVETLLSAGANPDFNDENGDAPLHVAAEDDSCDMIKLLLDHEADLECMNANGLTPLMSAALNDRLKACQYLLGKGANIDAMRLEDGASTLMVALSEQNHRAMELLLKHGADVDYPDHSGRTSLLRAAETGDTEACRILLDYDADMDVKAEDRTPLHHAVFGGHEYTVALLLDHGADAECVDSAGIFPLYTAVWNGDPYMCELLLNRMMNINMETLDGYNALSMAAYEGQLDVLRLLLDNGASGQPPSALNGKWKRQGFSDAVPEVVRKEVLQVLRQAKHT